MALAILELLDFDRARVRCRIDTGTNRYYQLKAGHAVERRNGIDWVEEIYFHTPLALNEAGGSLLNSSKEISLQASSLGSGKVYVQLFSFKTTEGRSPAFSSVIRVPLGAGLPPADGHADFAPSFSIATSMNMTDSFRTPRRIPCRTYGQVYSQQATLEDLLVQIVQAAAPVALKALTEELNGKGQKGAPAAGSDSTALLVTLLQAVLGSVAGSGISKQQSFEHQTRFNGSSQVELSRPFFTGVEIAGIIGALAPMIGPALQGVGQITGPIAQAMPQIIKEESAALPMLISALNQANQHRVQMKQADNKLAADVLSDINRRLLVDKLLEAQRQPPAGSQPGSTADLSQLIQLLQQVSAAAPQPAGAAEPPQPPPAAVAEAKSLALNGGRASTLSSRAVLSFVTAEPVAWNGGQNVLFTKQQGLQLKVRLNVVEPAPKSPLQKAILKLIFKSGPEQSVLFEKSFKQKDVLPNSPMAFSFSQDELGHLPVNKGISVLAEMRWLSPKSRREYKALGSTEIVLVNRYFLKEQGEAVSAEQELTDMKRFRPFWNKIWESPSLDRAGGRDKSEKKYLWELSVGAKYSVLLSAAHEANGLMETKILKGETDKESLTERTEGRLKAGIELSIAELNKLLPLWSGETALDREKLEAFMTDAFVKSNASEFVYNFKLKGRAAERGIVWVVPVFKLFECTLNTVARTDDSGQVVAMAEEKARFPLPVAARVIGLKSQK